MACGATSPAMPELGRLVAEHDDLSALGHLCIGGERLARHLGGQGLGTLTDGVSTAPGDSTRAQAREPYSPRR